jgi:transposase
MHHSVEQGNDRGPRRRVDCPRCGVTAELLPWADGKHHLTRAYAVFLARGARRLSWREVAAIFRTSWESVFRAVAWIVEYGLEQRSLSGIAAIGVDEVQFQKGHRYLTVVYQIDSACRRLLWLGPERTAKTLLRFFRRLGRERTAALQFVCSPRRAGMAAVPEGHRQEGGGGPAHPRPVPHRRPLEQGHR